MNPSSVALSRLKMATGALMILGGLGILFSMIPGLIIFSDEFADIRSEAKTITDTAERIGYYIGLAIFFFAMFIPGWIVSAMCMLSAWQLKRNQWRGFGFFIAILIMIPCFWNCGLAGFIVGPWLILVLLDTDVAALFSEHNTTPPYTTRDAGLDQSGDQVRLRSDGLSNPYQSPGANQDRFE